MVNFRNLTDKAKDLVEKRGGTDSLKRDAEELKGIAKGSGSISDKAKAALSALKDPGAAGAEGEAAKDTAAAGTAAKGAAKSEGGTGAKAEVPQKHSRQRQASQQGAQGRQGLRAACPRSARTSRSTRPPRPSGTW